MQYCVKNSYTIPLIDDNLINSTYTPATKKYFRAHVWTRKWVIVWATGSGGGKLVMSQWNHTHKSYEISRVRLYNNIEWMAGEQRSKVPININHCGVKFEQQSFLLSQPSSNIHERSVSRGLQNICHPSSFKRSSCKHFFLCFHVSQICALCRLLIYPRH